MHTLIALELWIAYHFTDILIGCAAWFVIATPLVLAIDRLEQ